MFLGLENVNAGICISEIELACTTIIIVDPSLSLKNVNKKSIGHRLL